MQPFIGRELFAAGFVSCWAQLNEASQKHLVRSLEMAFSSQNIPPEILATLLNLVCPLFIWTSFLILKNVEITLWFKTDLFFAMLACQKLLLVL